jgi:hypothetical protein
LKEEVMHLSELLFFLFFLYHLDKLFWQFQRNININCDTSFLCFLVFLASKWFRGSVKSEFAKLYQCYFETKWNQNNFLKRLTLHIKEQKQQLMKSNLTKGKDLRSNSTLLKHFIKNILTLDILTIH